MSDLARTLGEALAQRGLRLVTAESCTGGWVAKRVTDVPGSSAWFERGLVTYSNLAKEELLGVPAQVLERFGAVSAETAEAMVRGALAVSPADVAVAVTGIAGPDGGSADKPVGTVFLAWQRRGDSARVERRQFSGDRENVRRASVQAALAGLIELVEAPGGG